jgi:hypothetical protein
MSSPPAVTRAAAAPVRSALTSTAIADVLAGPSRPARVLGASPAAVYLAVEGGDPIADVVAIVASWAVRLPVAMTVSGGAPAVGDGAAVRVGGGGVDLGDLWLRPGRWVDPRPALPGPLVPARLVEAERRLAALPAAATGLGQVSVATVAEGMARGDSRPALALLGGGPGLTPAGDDLVAGAIAALALLGGLDESACGAVLARAPLATTSLSAALLRCAARGQVPPQVAVLLLSLCGRGAVEPALARLLEVGATSGAALALGLCAGARTHLRIPMEATR